MQKISDYTEDENTIQVFAKCDDFIEALCQRIKVKIPPFVLYRRAKVAAKQDESGKVVVMVTGMDVDEDLPYSFIKVNGDTFPVLVIDGLSLSISDCRDPNWRGVL